MVIMDIDKSRKKGSESLSKRILSFLLAALMLLCVAGCDGQTASDLLGNKSEDYSGEVPIDDIDSATVISTMTLTVTALTVNSVDLPEFSTPSEVIGTCRDAILNYMLTSDYSRFGSNTKLLSEIAQQYPDMTVTAAIGTKDYESTLYTLFGYSGTVRHSETKRFSYLSKVTAYVPTAPATVSNVALDIQSAIETEHTYQMSFFAMLEDEISPLYTALFVKKDDGMYLQSLSKGKGEKVNVSLDTTVS